MEKTDISFQRIRKLAIPALISGIAEPILSATDAAVVGNIPEYGVEALAAVGIVGAFLSALIWILGQTQSAISAIISQNLGAGTLRDLDNFPAQAIYLNLGFSIVILLTTYVFVDSIFTAMNAEGLILNFSIEYYNIRVWGFPLTLFTFAVFGIFRGLQNTFWPMVIATLGVVLNIVLDIVLVFGIENLVEPMGINGAAYASLISQAVMAILALVLLFKKTHIRLRLKLPVHPEIRRLISMSLNLFVRSIALNGAFILATREAATMGKEFVAAHTIAFNIWMFSAFFFDGFGAAGNILSGRLLGERNFNSLTQLAKKLNLYNLILSVLLIIAGIILYKPLGRLFNKDPDVLMVFYSIFYIVLISLPLNAFAFTFDDMFKGLGEMGFLRNVLLGATLFGFLPFLYLSKYLNWGLQGIWTALIIWMIFRGVFPYLKFRNKYRSQSS